MTPYAEYLGYVIERVGDHFEINTAPGCILTFASFDEATAFIDHLCEYNESEQAERSQ